MTPGGCSSVVLPWMPQQKTGVRWYLEGDRRWWRTAPRRPKGSSPTWFHGQVGCYRNPQQLYCNITMATSENKSPFWENERFSNFCCSQELLLVSDCSASTSLFQSPSSIKTNGSGYFSDAQVKVLVSLYWWFKKNKWN